MKTSIFTLLLLPISIIACHKENYIKPNATVSGVVLDKETNQPVSGAEIILVKNTCFGFFGSCINTERKKIKSVSTDRLGFFSLEFYNNNKKSYGLDVNASGYYSGGWYSSFDPDTSGNLIIHLSPK
jgi:hypothetical protein